MNLMQGDCLVRMKSIRDGRVAMVFADLPYGVTANAWDAVIPFGPLWAQLLRAGKPDCAYVFTATQPFATSLINSNAKDFRYDLVWVKNSATNFLNANRMPMPRHESVLVFYRQLPTYNAQKERLSKPHRVKQKASRTGSNYGKLGMDRVVTVVDKHPSSVLIFDRQMGEHPTQKPVALLEWLIKTYSNPGDTVLDPTMGSGTTAVACINTGRDFIGIERDPAYFEVAQSRVAEAIQGPGSEAS